MTAFTYRPSAPKPHVHPVTAPNGRVLTRAVTPDHPWQRGLWFSVKFVDEENFWEEVEVYGWQRQRDDHTVEWVRPDRGLAIVEERRLERVDEHTLDWTSTLSAPQTVVLDRTPYQGWGGYGGLAFRGAGDWDETRIAIEGASGPEVVGDRSRWCDLSGPDAGVWILDHPDNPRHPTPWYGNVANPLYLTDEPTNFVNAALLFHDPLDLPSDEPLRLRYRVHVHGGLSTWTEGATTSAWEDFARA